MKHIECNHRKRIKGVNSNVLGNDHGNRCSRDFDGYVYEK